MDFPGLKPYNPIRQDGTIDRGSFGECAHYEREEARCWDEFKRDLVERTRAEVERYQAMEAAREQASQERDRNTMEYAMYTDTCLRGGVAPHSFREWMDRKNTMLVAVLSADER
jgi:hypothetical protein